MKRYSQILVLSALLVYLSSPVALAQQEKPAQPVEDGQSAENTETPAGQEVEINEDNYRQFMELKDARQRRGILPEDAFKPRSGLQKLDKLPEESQKHLRNQLRGIIVRDDQWQPGDESKNYPYVPSEAARTNRSLQKQEAEAWGELVDSYHKREAEIYANSARSQAAKATDSSSGGGSNTGNGSPGDGTGQPGSGEKAGEQDSQQSRNKARSTANGYSPGDATKTNANGTAGTSQNAMEFLNRMQNGGGSSTEGGPADQSGGQGDGQAQAVTQKQAEQKRAVENDQGSSNDSGTASMAGTSQNAMEFLKGTGGQADDTGEGGAAASSGDGGQSEQESLSAADESVNQNQPVDISLTDPSSSQTSQNTTGSSQNAMEYLQGTANQESEKGEGLADSTSQNEGEGDDPGDGDKLAGQQSDDEQDPADITPPEGIFENDQNAAESESTAGAAQNALEYLAGDQQRADPGLAGPGGPANRQGTLSIQDLLNARGVNSGSGTLPPETDADDQQPPDENIPDKDNDG